MWFWKSYRNGACCRGWVLSTCQMSKSDILNSKLKILMAITLLIPHQGPKCFYLIDPSSRSKWFYLIDPSSMSKVFLFDWSLIKVQFFLFEANDLQNDTYFLVTNVKVSAQQEFLDQKRNKNPNPYKSDCYNSITSFYWVKGSTHNLDFNPTNKIEVQLWTKEIHLLVNHVLHLMTHVLLLTEPCALE